MSSNRFLKFIPSDKATWLDYNYPNAFRLLRIIAERARRYSGHIDGLNVGESLIGDSGYYGMTEKQYRIAKDILIRHNFIVIVETRRNRATNRAIKGTLVKLIDNSIWDINEEKENLERATSGASKGRLKGDSRATNKKDKKDKNNIEHIAQTASPLRKVEIQFSFDQGKFTGIEQEDYATWKALYPSCDISQELLRMTEWIKSNPSKGKAKKLWRKFITGWLNRANDQAMNKEAFKQVRTTPQMDHKSLVERHFKHGEVYNGAECFISSDGISFQRGMNHKTIKFKELGFKDQFDGILRHFGIPPVTYIPFNREIA